MFTTLFSYFLLGGAIIFFLGISVSIGSLFLADFFENPGLAFLQVAHWICLIAVCSCFAILVGWGAQYLWGIR